MGKLLKEVKLFTNHHHQEWPTVRDSVYEQIPTFKYLSVIACVMNLRIITEIYNIGYKLHLEAKMIGVIKNTVKPSHYIPFSQIKCVIKFAFKFTLISNNQRPGVMHISTLRN